MEKPRLFLSSLGALGFREQPERSEIAIHSEHLLPNRTWGSSVGVKALGFLIVSRTVADHLVFVFIQVVGLPFQLETR